MSDTSIPELAPRQWIYRNLTPWRIHACYEAGGSLQPRSKAGKEDNHVAAVLSIPAFGEVRVPREEAAKLRTEKMRRLGQIEVRLAPSEFWTAAPRAIVIFG